MWDERLPRWRRLGIARTRGTERAGPEAEGERGVVE